MRTEKEIAELEIRLEEYKERERELNKDVLFLKNQNTALVKKSIDLSDLKKKYEDRNYDLEAIQAELKKQHIQLVKKSVELSDVMRQLEDKNYDLKQLQTTLEDIVVSRTIELREKNAQLMSEIDERSEAQAALAKSEEKYKTIFHNTGTVIMMIEEDMTISMVNAKIEEVSGFSVDEVEGKMKWVDFVADKKQLEIMKYYHRQRRLNNDTSIPNEYEFMIRHKDGTAKEVVVTIDIIPGHGRSIASVMDLSSLRTAERKQKKLEGQLAQTQKMESIGLLAGGIAHDFNNILAAIMGYIEMSRNSAFEGSSIRRWLDQASQACDRARELIIQILTFSRQNEQTQVPINPGLIVREALKFLRASIPTSIRFDITIDKQCGSIMGDATQFHQIIMNLCTNAAYAMDDNKGVIAVSLEKVAPDDTEVQSIDMKNPPGFVKLSIRDTGHGMSQNVLDRIFEPFFTTKEMGEGTGMGLAVTHGIVKSFNGEIIVESQEGRGTVFHMYFPVVTAGSVTKKENTGIIQGGNETILLVDDDEALLEMLHELIESIGYNVVSCQDSVRAGNMFCEAPEDFDLVITDQTMPGMTGAELAQRILARRKDIPIILCTGYNDTVAPELVEKIGISEFLSKPVKKNRLSEVIGRLLEK